ncbi:MAG TPA: hypothetical protein VI112_01760 [Bacteroidia bacterium]|jgi:hypothetical protein
MRGIRLFLSPLLLLLSGSFIPAGTSTGCPSRIDVSNGKVSIDGKMPEDFSIGSFQKILGPPTRIDGTVFIYDNCGISLFAAADAVMLSEMQVHFRHENVSTAPENDFAGKFTLQGKEIRGGESFDKVRSSFPRYRFDHDKTYPEGYRKGIYVIVDKANNDPGVGCVSFGPGDR